jgi:hypothetical protein
MKLSIKEYLRRIKGFSSPFGGINWDLPQDDKKILYSLFQKLGDRRLLRRTHGEFEYNYVLESLNTMRHNVTNALCELQPTSKSRLYLENIMSCLHGFQTYVELDYKQCGYKNIAPSNELLEAFSCMRNIVGGNLYDLQKVLKIDIPNELRNSFRIQKSKIV